MSNIDSDSRKNVRVREIMNSPVITGSEDETITEISANAKGAIYLGSSEGQIKSIIDIGGQDTKAIVLDKEGKIINFVMNDKCAAGTGAFLEKTGRYMGYETAEISNLLSTSKDPVEISGVCAVFAEFGF